jgi:hypothetical protein
MKKLVIVFVLVLTMLLVSVTAGMAITEGELDGDGHPQVVLLVMELVVNQRPGAVQLCCLRL